MGLFSNNNITATSSNAKDSERFKLQGAKRFDMQLSDKELTLKTYTIPFKGDGENNWFQEDTENFYLQNFFHFHTGSSNYYSSSWEGNGNNYVTTTFPLHEIKNLISIKHFLKDPNNGLDPKDQQAALAQIEKKIKAFPVKEQHEANVWFNFEMKEHDSKGQERHPNHVITITNNEYFTVQALNKDYIFDRSGRPKNPPLDVTQFNDATATPDRYNKDTTARIDGPIDHKNLQALMKIAALNLGQVTHTAKLLLVEKPQTEIQGETLAAGTTSDQKSNFAVKFT